MSDVELLRRIGKALIWLGAAACAAHLLLTLPGVGSPSGFFLLISDTIARLSTTVGLGAVLLALTHVIDAIYDRVHAPPREESPPS